MINITDKHNCCGCSACVQRCPKQCISLHEGNEGFLYPHVNTNDCINCGLCEKVCPWLNRQNKLQPLEVLAVKNRNEEERMASSSGGVFIALAKKVIADGGVVFGAVFDENWEVKHTYADKIEDVRPMMGSKYLQSRIGNSYKDAEKFLNDGRLVLFTGSPCQITGLHNFLHKNYLNLISVEYLCHGVPSPGIWRTYLKEIIKKIGNVSQITNIEFRNKKSGWDNFSIVISGKTNVNSIEHILYSDIHRNNTYMRGFLSDIYLRPSCYNCKCKNGISHSDLTIADYWAVDLSLPDFKDDKGVGLVLINTEKGKHVFDSLDMESRSSNLSDAKLKNGGFNEHVVEHPKRNQFFEYLHHGVSFDKAISKALYVPVHKIIIGKIKNKVRRFIYK